MARGSTLLDPFEPENVGPASIDLRLGTSFRIPLCTHLTHIDLADVPRKTTVGLTLDGPNDRFVLHPGKTVLASTAETITVPTDLTMCVDGKSSLGRLFLAAHVTAGYFDPGWHGIGTLELVNLSSIAIILRPGVLICQSRWMRLTDTCERPYAGRYQGDTGAAGSRYGFTD